MFNKFISLLLGICLCAPMAQGLADQASPTPQPTLTSVEFETPAANAAQTAALTIMRVAQMEQLLGTLALDAQSVGQGWSAQDDIADYWAPIYSYINAYELNADNDWEHTEQGFVRVPADYVKQLFCDMYGVEFEELPPVSRNYSSLIVYDSTSDMYDVTGSDVSADVRQAVLRSVEINDNGSATVSYDIVTGEGDDALTAAVATIYLETGAPSTYGLKPIKVDMAGAVG